MEMFSIGGGYTARHKYPFLFRFLMAETGSILEIMNTNEKCYWIWGVYDQMILLMFKSIYQVVNVLVDEYFLCLFLLYHYF